MTRHGRLVLQRRLNFVLENDFFLEGISTSSRVFHSLDDFRVFNAPFFLQGCYYFLCHCSKMLSVNNAAQQFSSYLPAIAVNR